MTGWWFHDILDVVGQICDSRFTLRLFHEGDNDCYNFDQELNDANDKDKSINAY